MTKLQQLHTAQVQSPWLDNLTREYLRDGTIARMVGDGIRGVTANPTILAKAIEGSADYDEQFSSLMADGLSVEDAYWELVVADVIAASAVLRPVFDASGGTDGFVSVKVAPELARDTPATIAATRQLHERMDEPNVFVKIPATGEGVPAIEAMIADGRCGAGRRSPRPSSPTGCSGRVSPASGRERLAELGAQRQRPLWASTSTKNPAYPDTLYVDSLIGPDTINTLPESTIAAFEDHGTLARTIDTGVEEAAEVMRQLAGVGIDMDDVGRTLEDNGVAGFHESFQGVLAAPHTKVRRLVPTEQT